MAKITLGDVFQIDTPNGFAVLHFVYQDKSLGELVRAVSGLYSKPPDDLEKVVSSKEQFMVFFPVQTALNRRIIKRIGNLPHQRFGKPKLMRIEHIVRGKFLGWHIVDTETWRMELVERLTSEQKKLSPWGIWNDTLLVEKLAAGWKPEDWDQSSLSG